MALVPLLRSLRGSDIDRARAAETALLTGERTRRQTIQRELERALCSDDESLPTLGESLDSGRPVRLPWRSCSVTRSSSVRRGLGRPTLWSASCKRCGNLVSRARSSLTRKRRAWNSLCALWSGKPADSRKRSAKHFSTGWSGLTCFRAQALPCLQVLSDNSRDGNC